MNNPKVGDLIYRKDLGLVRVLKVRSAERDLDLRVQDSRGLLWDVNSNYVRPFQPASIWRID